MRKAKEKLPKVVYDYYASGADDEDTLHHNVEDYSRIKLLPRVLVDVSVIDMKTKILGHAIDFPVGFSPTALQKMAHTDGELATSRVAKKLNIPNCVSTIATYSLEDVAKESGLRFFQLYVMKSRKLTLSMLKRAEEAGYSAIVVTVDMPVSGNRENDKRNPFRVPDGMGYPNLSIIKDAIAEKTKGKNESELAVFFKHFYESTLDWSWIDWVRTVTKLPIVLKGIVTYEDALIAIDHGIQAIWVSNHGGRQLDTCISTIQALPMVVKAKQDREAINLEIYLDCGIRRGTDILKALALGANAVFIGRPVLWGLACGGQEGIEAVFEIFRSEFERAMSLCGCRTLADIRGTLLYKPQQYSSNL